MRIRLLRQLMVAICFLIVLLGNAGSPALAVQRSLDVQRSESEVGPAVWSSYGYDRIERGSVRLRARLRDPAAPTRCGPGRPLNSRPVRVCASSSEYDAQHLLRVSQNLLATKTGETSRIWRAVEPDELKDLLGSGQSRPGPGNEGKYFFPTKGQAEVLAKEILPGRRFCVTSGCIDSSVLAKIEKICPAGEGQAWFIPNELLPFIKNIVNHGPVG